MPVQIRELVIRAEVLPENATPPSSAATAALQGVPEEQKAAIIQECIEQIMLILEKQKDR